MRISDWSSDVCSSDLIAPAGATAPDPSASPTRTAAGAAPTLARRASAPANPHEPQLGRSQPRRESQPGQPEPWRNSQLGGSQPARHARLDPRPQSERKSELEPGRTPGRPRLNTQCKTPLGPERARQPQN